STSLDKSFYLTTVDAFVTPPAGWAPDPLKKTSRHAHQVWISPSGRTAYGVIHFKLPFPIGHELALWGFMQEMRKSQGEGHLISKRWDQNLRGMRFVSEGGLYALRTNLLVRGFEGWAIYAGTLRHQQIVAEELAAAEGARE